MSAHECHHAKLPKLDDPGRIPQMNPTALWHALGDPDASVVVDIGAGTGILSAEWARLAPAATVFGADTSPEALEWMREHRHEVAEGRLVPLLAEDTHVPLPDGVAGVVTTLSLHHELADPVAVYAEALRLLAPRGMLLVVDWKPGETPKGPPVAIRVTAETIVASVEAAGFAETCIHDVLAEHSVVTARKPA